MKIKIDQRDLAKHINIAQRGISNRTTMQILDGILIETWKGRLKITGTDLEISIETFVDCEIEEEGSIVVNSKIFGDIIKKLPNEKILIDVDKNNINIKCEKSEFNILGNLGEEYPELPIVVEKDSFSIPMDMFKGIIRQTVFATTKDETRPSLTGVLVELQGDKISFVALDGYRLTLKTINTNSNIQEKMIIPGRTLEELNKILDDGEEDVKINMAPGHVIFNIGETVMYSRLLEGQFFNYKDIIRKEHETKVIVDRDEFQRSLERASLLAREDKANLIKLSIEDNKIIIRSNTEIGNVYEEVISRQEGEDLNIAFNSRYILEGIKVMEEDKIQLSFMGSLNPCIIYEVGNEDYTYLVLPVRLAQEDF